MFSSWMLEYVTLLTEPVVSELACRPRRRAHIQASKRRYTHLDTGAILAVEHLAIAEDHAVDRVVGLAAYGADGEAVTAVAEHVRHHKPAAGRDRDAVVLVVHDVVRNEHL